MAWQPVLDGAMAETARTTVLDIAHAIARREGDPAPVTDRALFWAYLAGAFDDAWIADEYDTAITELIDSAPQWLGNLSLYGGAAGFGFVVAHISEPGAADPSLDAIDSLIADELAVEAWTHDYDLIGGLAGVGVYLVERGDAALTAIDSVVGHLLATSEVGPAGRTWLTRPDLLPSHQREQFPDGSYNCGLAHGMPGVLAFLARAAALGNARACTAAEEASRWLAAQRIADSPGKRYPTWIGRDHITQGGTRSAWCYGDAGVAISTFGVARRLGHSLQPALDLARESAAIPFESAHIVDAGLCHGAAGLAHIYNRLYQATGEPDLRDAAHTWFANVFRLRGNAAGVAGFAAHAPELGETGENEWVPNTSLLSGAIGIALALLAAIRPDEPNWDRMLMCDV